MDRNTQYLQDISSSQLDLKIQCNQIKILVRFLVNIDKLIIKFIWRGKRPE